MPLFGCTISYLTSPFVLVYLGDWVIHKEKRFILAHCSAGCTGSLVLASAPGEALGSLQL